MVSTNTPIGPNQSSVPNHEEGIKPDRGPIASAPGERHALSRITHALEAGQNDAVKIVVGDGPVLDVPPSLLRVLQRGAATLEQDDAVTMGRVGKLLTIRQAAEILGVPPASLAPKLDNGELPSVVVDDVRRVPLDRLLEYHALVVRQRRAAILQMTRSSEEMGLYDLEYEGKLDRFPETDDEAGS